MTIRRWVLLWLASAGIGLAIAAQVGGQTPVTRFVVVPAYYSDQTPGYLQTQAELLDMAKQATGLWHDASSGALTYAVTIAPSFRIDHPMGSCSDESWETAAAVAASNAGFAGDVTLFYTNHGACRSDAPLGGNSLSLTIYNAGTAAHEVGHQLGRNHAWSLVWHGVVGDFSKIVGAEYSDPDCVMGDGNLYVCAIERRALGWLLPKTLARIPSQAITLGVGAANAVIVPRADGTLYFLEAPTANAPPRLRVNSPYHSWIDNFVPGKDPFEDTVGGVRITYLGALQFKVEAFAPTYKYPTPDPRTTPTSAPTYSANTPTPVVTECWTVPNYVRCSPTPAPVVATPVRPTEPPTAAPTAIAPTRTAEPPTPAPTCTTVPTPVCANPPIFSSTDECGHRVLTCWPPLTTPTPVPCGVTIELSTNSRIIGPACTPTPTPGGGSSSAGNSWLYLLGATVVAFIVGLLAKKKSA